MGAAGAPARGGVDVNAQLSADARRARRLLVGGLVGGVAAGLVGTVACLIGGGSQAGASAAAAAIAVVVFFAVGQLVQVVCADLRPVWILVASLASYALRIGVLGLVLFLAWAHADEWGLVRGVVAGQTVVGVVGWLAGEIWAFSRLRIPVFDSSTGDGRS